MLSILFTAFLCSIPNPSFFLFLLHPVAVDHIIGNVRRESPFFQSPVNTSRRVCVDNGKHWNSDDHADEAEQASAHQNGEQYPEAGQPCRIAKDLWSQDIAVELLQQQYEYYRDKLLTFKELEK